MKTKKIQKPRARRTQVVNFEQALYRGLRKHFFECAKKAITTALLTAEYWAEKESARKERPGLLRHIRTLRRKCAKAELTPSARYDAMHTFLHAREHGTSGPG